MENVRVRFAPSPTGPLHMGGVRTALFNYLFAKRNGGEFILRIEDTDQNRFVPRAEQYIQESLAWVGIKTAEDPWQGGDYGPYRQSERKDLYKRYAMQLIESGHAYYAFDTSEELTEMRERLTRAKVPSPQYNAAVRMTMKNSLTLSADDVEKKLANGDPYTIRLKVPRNEEIRFQDMIRGWVQVNSNAVDDKVLFKSDGMPTYHLANIVDDHLMKISHVIRGEEWLPSAPIHILIYRYLGWEDVRPEFAHLPLILKPDGNGKLSKRDGDRLGFPVFPLQWTDPSSNDISSGYREMGYFPEAFINMIAFLGWNPGTDQEVFSLDELCQTFSLDRVGKSGSKFDADKTKWYNQVYLRQKSDFELGQLIKPHLEEKKIPYQETDLEPFAGLMKERAFFVSDMLEGIYLWVRPDQYDEKILNKKWRENSADIVRDLIDCFADTDYSSQALESTFKAYLLEKELGMGAAMPLLRVFITGKGVGPAVFDMMTFLGKEECEARLQLGLLSRSNG